MTAVLVRPQADIPPIDNEGGVLLLDVDGVLNPLSPYPLPGYRTWHYQPPLKHPEATARVMRLHPEHGAWLTSLATKLGLQLGWCTPLRSHANQFIGPKIGLLPLPFVDVTYQHGWGHRFQAVLRYVAGRPLVWLDDQFHTPAAHCSAAPFWRARGDQKTLLWNVHSHRGLTKGDIEGVRQWWTTH